MSPQPTAEFWRGKRVLVTGHSGFKGAWLCTWLQELGAEIVGLSLDAPSSPSLWPLLKVPLSDELRVDITHCDHLQRALDAVQPAVIFHLAAQPIVRDAYYDPVPTFAANLMGTVHLLQAARGLSALEAVLVATTDKCYYNHEWVWPYRETDRLGGKEPYAASKACAELATEAMRLSYFSGRSCARIITARAGNVIGGGDWGMDRLLTDVARWATEGQELRIRAPQAVRPWQHVLDVCSAYLTLAEAAASQRINPDSKPSWNVGPLGHEALSVKQVLTEFARHWPEPLTWHEDESERPPESTLLQLDSSRIRQSLGWRPRLSSPCAVRWTAEWLWKYKKGQDMHEICLQQLHNWTEGKNLD